MGAHKKDDGSEMVGQGKKVPYSSMETRFFSFDQFLGMGRIDESYSGHVDIPCENNEDLRAKFNSGLPARMLPTTFGLKFPVIPIYRKPL